MPGLLRNAPLIALICLALSGCAAGRSIVAVPGVTAENPATGTAVKITAVDDNRAFITGSRDRAMPSLSDHKVEDTSITRRAFARKSGAYGDALGDLLLPEGQSVSQLVSDAIATGFKRAGYRVIGPADAGYDQALPVSAKITQFWSWFTPGVFMVSVSHRSEIALQAPGTPVTGETIINGWAETSNAALTEKAFLTVSTEGLEAIAAKTAEALRKTP